MSIDRIPLPIDRGGLWLCARCDVAADPDGALAWADARNKAAILLQVLRRFLRIEHDGSVEEREENNQHHVKGKKQGLSVAEERRH